MLEKVPIPFEQFKEKLEENSKVLFSGIFGSGKTTFINDFFDKNDDYESIHIYPINYSIASNEDIFELIKYDILFQLIGKIPKEDFFKLELPYHLTLYTYLTGINGLESKLDFLASFLNFIGKYGSAALKVYEQLKYLKDEYVKFHGEFQENDFDKIQSYLEEATNQKGHIYEEDLFTEIIRVLVTQIKEKNENQIVLVIDDLDRLDPEHIFRILNIFSAHIDFLGVENDNKFNFDKVILICDYSNIEGIYKYRYGPRSNFIGYLDKFYDDIFWYDSSSYIRGIINKYLKSIKTNGNNSLIDKRSRAGNQILYIFNQFLRYNLINFRSLIRYKQTFDLNSSIERKTKRIGPGKSLMRQQNLYAEIVICFLEDFFDNTSVLLDIINQANKKEMSKDTHEYDADIYNMLGDLLLLINHSEYDRTYMKNKGEDIFDVKYEELVFKCKFISNVYDIGIVCQSIEKNGNEVSLDEVRYFAILENAVKVYLDFIR